QVRALDQCHGVMGQLAVIDRAVEAHLRRVWAIGPLVQLADLLEADDLGPESVRLLDVADIQHEVVDAGRAHRLGRDIGIRLSHGDLPKSAGYLVLRLAGSGKRYAAIAGVTERRTSTTRAPGLARANRSSSVSLTRLEPVISTTSASGITVRASSAGRKKGISSAFSVAGFCSSTRKGRRRCLSTRRNGTNAPTTTTLSAGRISVASKASTPMRSSASGCGRRRQQVSASAFSAAMPSPRP